MNKWGIPKDLEEKIRDRDKQCVYCSIEFDSNVRSQMASWEHIINDAKIITYDNIALCCISCNASKGSKSLDEWLETNYCKRKNIIRSKLPKYIRGS